MTKSMVIKLRTFEMVLDIQLAQGVSDQTERQEKLAEMVDKLAKNVEIDESHAGEASQSVPFDG